MIVGAQDEDAILNRNDNDQRPEDERQYAENIIRRGGDGVRAVKALAHSVERAGPYVAVNDAERRERKNCKIAPARRGRMWMTVLIRERRVNVCRSCCCHNYPERERRSSRDKASIFRPQQMRPKDVRLFLSRA
jgi:hypothetical protein